MKPKSHRARNPRLPFEGDQSVLPPIRVGVLKPKNILVPTDFSECSAKAVTYAVSLAKHFQSEITLLHVAQFIPATASLELVTIQSDMLDAQVREDSARQLSQWLSRIAEHVPAVALVGSGPSVHEEIVEIARENQCDLIVIAIHPKGALEHLLTGSVAEKVVQHAPCPVFVVREREHDFIKIKPRVRRTLAAV